MPTFPTHPPLVAGADETAKGRADHSEFVRWAEWLAASAEGNGATVVDARFSESPDWGLVVRARILGEDGEEELALCWGAPNSESHVAIVRNLGSGTLDITRIADFSPDGELRDPWPPARIGDEEVERSESDSPHFASIKAGSIGFGAMFDLKFLDAAFSEAPEWGFVVRARFLDEVDEVRLVIGWLPHGADEFEIAYAPLATADLPSWGGCDNIFFGRGRLDPGGDVDLDRP